MASLGIDEETIRAASEAAMEAHRNPQPYSVRPVGSSVEIIAFRGSWSENDWVVSEGKGDSWGLNDWLSVEKPPVEPIKNSKNPLLQLLPSLRSIGNVELVAKVNGAFFNQFLSITNHIDFSNKVKRAVEQNKKIIFTGHSGAGPVAIFATIWLLEQLKSNRAQSERPHCVTFGSPLTGNYILNHALRREKWADNFIHFVNRYDVVPRVFLAPPSVTKDRLQKILPFFGNNSVNHEAARDLFETVLRNATCVASEAACEIIGSTNMLQETISNFVELSPYRPFGTFVFGSGDGKFVVVRNADAVLQLLVFASQLSSVEEADVVARASLEQHLTYRDEVSKLVAVDELYCFKDFVLEQDPEDESGFIEDVLNEPALDDLGLSARGRLCILAAREWEKQKKLNQKKLESKAKHMNDLMKDLVDYRAKREASGVGYYDGFKQQKEEHDFKANIKRLELAGIWDEILELLKKRPMQLPDEFEGDENWIKMGTEYRRLVEPLDIANYYRHAKGKDSKEYLRPGSRPKRYFYTQRWLEHYKQMDELSGESTFWAVVEELKIKMTVKEKRYGEVKDEIAKLDANLGKWYQSGVVQKDAFLPKSTLVEWWNTLTPAQRKGCRIEEII